MSATEGGAPLIVLELNMHGKKGGGGHVGVTNLYTAKTARTIQWQYRESEKGTKRHTSPLMLSIYLCIYLCLLL